MRTRSRQHGNDPEAHPDWQAVAAREPDHISKTVAEVIRLEQRERVDMGASEHLANFITALAGSMLFVALHIVWFGAWVLLHEPPFGLVFDPFPFELLSLVVGLEAIFLSTFVLISQNRQARQADRRAKVDLEVNVITERELTKLIDMVGHISRHLRIDDEHDRELQDMRRRTSVTGIADAVDEAERVIAPESANGPDSAADTEA